MHEKTERQIRMSTFVYIYIYIHTALYDVRVSTLRILQQRKCGTRKWTDPDEK